MMAALIFTALAMGGPKPPGLPTLGGPKPPGSAIHHM